MVHSLFLTLAQAAPEGAAVPPQSPLSAFVPFILIAIIFYFLLIRPQQKRQRDHANLVAAVKTGDEVILNSGIHGIVANVKERTLIIKVADNVKIEFEKSAVASVQNASKE